MKEDGRRAALYLRLSREDEEHENGSESIRNQRELLLRYAEERGFEVCGEYADDGWSGTSFERPGFLRLLREIESGEVDIVLTKDLSRLGRDYILTGYYIERYFPEHGVRYIAVTDGVDTGDTGAANDITPFKAVINDLYARDISKKVRAALETKRACGKYIGARAPYGYKKDTSDKNRLVPDEEKAEHVQLLFRLVLGGESLCGTARRMDALGIPPPGAERGATNWNDAMVRRILTNPVYRGDLAQGKSRKLGYKVKRRAAVPPEAWTVVQDAHMPIVRREVFEAVRRLLEKRSRRPRLDGVECHPLASLVFCGECGASMTLLRQGTRSYFVCSGWKRGKGCSVSHCIRSDAVLESVREALRQFLSGIAEDSLLANNAYPEEKQLNRLKQKHADTENALLCLYRDKARGIVPEGEYLHLAQALRQEAQTMEEQINRGQKAKQEAGERLKQTAGALLRPETLQQGELAVLIERITVGNGKALNIRFAFREPSTQATE